MPTPGANPRGRARALLLGSFVVLSLFGAQLVRIQGLDADATALTAQKLRTMTETLPALRGTIYDATGTILASSIERRTITVNQRAVVEYKKRDSHGTVIATGVAAAAADLAPLLKTTTGKLTPLLTGRSQYNIIAKEVSPVTWHSISELGIPGVSSERSSMRTYPQSTTAASLVGFVDGAQVGAGGVEMVLDRELRGRAGMLDYEVGQDGARLPNGLTTEEPAQPGRDVRLTIRNDLQWYAQNALAQKVTEVGATSGTVVVQSTKTGELLALASYPTFDPSHVDPKKGSLANLAFTEVFEPGSTAKVLTAAAALEEGTVTASTPMIVPYSLHRADRVFSDSHVHSTEYLTFAGALAQSSNTGIILTGETMPPATLDSYFRKFGFGKTSEVGFPAESPGILAPYKQWDGSQRYTVMFGQGVSITAIQAASVYQTIANKGVRMPPVLIDAIADGSGSLVRTPRTAGTRVVSERTATELNKMLEGVVSKDGTAPQAKVDGYRVAGKTGTAMRIKEGVGYSGYTASFIGFAPAEDPQIVVSVIVQNPVNTHYGGTVAAPVFHDVMTYALQSLKIPPTPQDLTPPQLTLKLDHAPDPADPGVLSDRRRTG